MALGLPYGMPAMLKEGHKMMSGLEEAVLKNVEACKSLAQITRTSLGPNGMNKMVINHLEKLFVTSDASTITGELEVQHPAAKLLVGAAQSQAQEIGDGTNLVLTLGGELLARSEPLLLDGMHPVEIADGYAEAAKEALRILDDLAIPGSEKLDVRDQEEVARRISACIGAKQSGSESVLAPLVAEACAGVLPETSKDGRAFSVDDVRVVKIPGGSLEDSRLYRGMVLRRGPEGSVERVQGAARVAVFATGVDTSATETKGTVLLRSAAELEGYSAGEEAKVEDAIRAVAASGANVVISGGAIGEIALHHLNRLGVLVLRVPSKFDLRRICRATGATALLKLSPPPSAADLGACSSVEAVNIGGARCTVLSQARVSRIATVVLRGATAQYLDDVERAVDDGVNAFRALTKDPRVLPAGGAVEAELAKVLRAQARLRPGLDAQAFSAFADSLDSVPRALAENSGLAVEDALASLAAAHAEGRQAAGLDLASGEPKDLGEAESAFDLFSAKWWAIRLAADAAATVLRVDQIIMAKAAGGPKPRRGGADEDVF